MAHISVHAFGIGMIFRVPEDADMSDLASEASRAKRCTGSA